MALLLRALARLATFVLLVVFAVAGLAIALFSIRGGHRPLSLAALAENLDLPAFEDTFGDWLRQLSAPGPVAKVALLAGLGAMLLGLVLLLGALASRKERLLILEEHHRGVLAARRRPLGQIAAALCEQARGVTSTKVTVRANRRGRGGRVEITASHPRNAPPEDVREKGEAELAPLVGPFGLRARVRPVLGQRGARVQ